jgi:hypothetical protein
MVSGRDLRVSFDSLQHNQSASPLFQNLGRLTYSGFPQSANLTELAWHSFREVIYRATYLDNPRKKASNPLFNPQRTSMDAATTMTISRKSIAVRLLFSLLFLIIFELLKIIVVFSTLFQFVYLFFAGTYSQPLRSFCNKLSSYAYRMLRYVTLNDNSKPFPFSEFSKEMDQPTEDVRFE